MDSLDSWSFYVFICTLNVYCRISDISIFHIKPQTGLPRWGRPVRPHAIAVFLFVHEGTSGRAKDKDKDRVASLQICGTSHLGQSNNNNNNASVFILRRLHPDDNEQVITTLWTEAHYI